MTSPDLLAAAIKKRSGRRHLSVSLEKSVYANHIYLDQIPKDNPRDDTLIVGVGSGHEMLLNLINNEMRNIDGVDPYIATDGNDDEDYQDLLALIDELGLAEQFHVTKATIENYLETNEKKYDVICAMDVLHHIYWTDKNLRDTTLFQEAVTLFGQLKNSLRDGGVLIISEVEKSGLRPWLHNRNIAKGDVNFRTKQHWWEWDFALRTAGFKKSSLTIYVPYALRNFKFFLNNQLGLYTACNRYIMVYK